MESTDLQILNSGEIEVDPTLLNYVVTAIIKNKNINESGDNDIELQQILFYSAQFHSDIDSIMRVDFLMRVRDAIQLMEVPASPIVIDCPFMDCMGTLVDDLRDIRLGHVPSVGDFSVSIHHYGGYHDELEEDEEEEEEDEDDDDDDEGEEEERGG
uniref:Uncharacterized protein n=1 Tax=Solanum tuberosum TaxID=4113 RepID=M1DVY1_SOLTU